MAASKPPAKAVVARSKKVFALPTGTMWYGQLTKPDEDYDKFSVCIIFTPEELDRVAETIQARCIDALKDELEQAWPAKSGAFPDPISAKQWLEDRQRETSDGQQFIRFENKASFEYDGKTINITMSAWDAKNSRLDLAKLRLGRGSRIQAVLKPALTCGGKGPAIPSPKLELTGVRVIKLVQYQAGPGLDAVDEAEISEAEDLSAFAGSGRTVKEAPEGDDLPESDAPF